MRALLVIIALGLSIAIMISVPAGIVANQEATQNLSANYDKAISQMEQQLTLIECTNSSSSSSPSPADSGSAYTPRGEHINYMNESAVVDAISSMPGVGAVVPILEVPEGIISRTFTGFNGNPITFNTSSYTVVGVPLNSFLINSYSILPTNITAGRNLQQGDSGVVVLSLNNTEYFGVGVGDEVNILGTNFKVVGVHGESGSSSYFMGRASDIGSLFMNITDAQAVTGHTGEMSRLDVYAENSSATLVSALASEISDLSSDFSVTTMQSQLQTIENRYNSTLAADEAAISQTQTVAFQEIIISVLATCLVVLFVMLYTVRERTKEIGTLKAIGFSNWNVMSQFMLEGMLLSIGAGVVGIAIGSVGASSLAGLLGLLPAASRNSLFGSSGASPGLRYYPGATSGARTITSGLLGTSAVPAVVSPQLMLLGLGVAVLLGALGSLYPAWRASRTRPAEAMRYE
jgi:putative ABC transport system permease protein